MYRFTLNLVDIDYKHTFFAHLLTLIMAYVVASIAWPGYYHTIESTVVLPRYYC